MLTVNIIKVSEDRLNVIPFQKAALPDEGLGKHHILVNPERKCFHRYGFKLQGLVGGKLCGRNKNPLRVTLKVQRSFDDCEKIN